MSEPGDRQGAPNPSGTPPPADTPPDQLPGLMAPTGADLDARALRAAEAAIEQGERALAAARGASTGEAASAPARARNPREFALRLLLAVNLLAMATVALLPAPRRSAPPAVETAPPPANDPVVAAPSLDDPVIAAFAAADRRDYRTAIAMLQDYLEQTPRLDEARKANVLLALEHYAAQLGDFAQAQGYQRRLEGLRTSQSMAEDLVHMAAEAERNGDVESMRRNYARLLLQQRQIPSALYRHVAEAYLKLGDSYRQQADGAEQKEREAELEALRERLRQQALQGAGGKEETGKSETGK